MTIIEILNTAKEPTISYEIVPPPRGKRAEDVLTVVSALVPYNPAWIDVTSHSPVAQFYERRDGTFHRRLQKKRPGTLSLCGVIQNRFKIDVVAHVLALGFSAEETEDALIELSYLGVENVLALRGDGHADPATEAQRQPPRNSIQLIEQISNLKKGKFLNAIDDSEPINFSIGAAGYPEKHFESPNLKEDIKHLKRKVDAGAEYIVTQMFFDNAHYFKFVELCRAEGITVPIIPGLKVIKSAGQLRSLPKTFHINLPEELAAAISEKPDQATQIGVAFAKKQSEELLSKGAPGVHFFVMNDASSVIEVVRHLRSI